MLKDMTLLWPAFMVTLTDKISDRFCNKRFSSKETGFI